jgi:hypothetical protein
MKKQSWMDSSNIRCNGHSLRKDKRRLKRLRSKRRRHAADPKLVEKQTSAWDLA